MAASTDPGPRVSGITTPRPPGVVPGPGESRTALNRSKSMNRPVLAKTRAPGAAAAQARQPGVGTARAAEASGKVVKTLPGKRKGVVRKLNAPDLSGKRKAIQRGAIRALQNRSL